MRLSVILVIFFSSLLLISGNLTGQEPSSLVIVGRVLDSIKNIRTQQCEVKSIEKTDGTMVFAESFIKINIKPKKIYYKNSIKGNELLWVHGQNKGDATVHARSIPFMNINLDPYGSIMRRESHHTIFDLGFQYIGSIIANTIVMAPKDFNKHFSIAGSIIWNDIDCYRLIISFPDYKYVEYTSLKNETAYSIGIKLSTSDYKIRLKNDLSSYFGTIKEGTKLIVPTQYAKKVILFIDKKTYLPISVKIFDEAGLFESYEFYNVKINIPFSKDEFSTENKDYGF